MATSLTNIIIKSNKIAGIHCQFSNEGEYSFYLTIIRKKDNEVNLLELQSKASLTEIAKACKGLPVILSIDGKGIVHKKTRFLDSNNITDKLFPGITASQFYVQTFPSVNGEIFASICRKEQLDQLISLIETNAILITDIILGPFTLVSSFNEIDFFSGTSHVCIANSKLSEIERSDATGSSIQKGKFELKGHEIIAFANASFYLSGEKIQSDIDKSKFQNNYKYAKLFNFGLYSGLLVIFLVLLINFLAFDHYHKKYNILDQQLMFNAELSKKLETLRIEYKAKQELLEKSGLLQNSRITFYINEIIRQMPDNIKLRRLNFQPIAGKVKENEEIVLENNIVVISGVSMSGEPVNNWILKLKKIGWIKEATIENYTQEDFNIPGEFELRINLKIK